MIESRRKEISDVTNVNKMLRRISSSLEKPRTGRIETRVVTININNNKPVK